MLIIAVLPLALVSTRLYSTKLIVHTQTQHQHSLLYNAPRFLLFLSSSHLSVSQYQFCMYAWLSQLPFCIERNGYIWIQ